MDKEELKEDIDKSTPEKDELNTQTTDNDITDQKSGDKNLDLEKKEEEKLTPEQELETLKDKLARTFAEMENQRRRFEKERDDAYEYGGFSFAKEALNLLDNLGRSKIALENDEKLKDSDALKKIEEHLDIINNDMLSIFTKTTIEPIKSINENLETNLNNAMMKDEEETKAPGKIAQEIQKGYRIKDS